MTGPRKSEAREEQALLVRSGHGQRKEAAADQDVQHRTEDCADDRPKAPGEDRDDLAFVAVDLDPLAAGDPGHDADDRADCPAGEADRQVVLLDDGADRQGVRGQRDESGPDDRTDRETGEVEAECAAPGRRLHEAGEGGQLAVGCRDGCVDAAGFPVGRRPVGREGREQADDEAEQALHENLVRAAIQLHRGLPLHELDAAQQLAEFGTGCRRVVEHCDAVHRPAEAARMAQEHCGLVAGGEVPVYHGGAAAALIFLERLLIARLVRFLVGVEQVLQRRGRRCPASPFREGGARPARAEGMDGRGGGNRVRLRGGHRHHSVPPCRFSDCV
jgi:hypothetical protein